MTDRLNNPSHRWRLVLLAGVGVLVGTGAAGAQTLSGTPPAPGPVPPPAPAFPGAVAPRPDAPPRFTTPAFPSFPAVQPAPLGMSLPAPRALPPVPPIAAGTPVKDLLPTAPKTEKVSGPLQDDDLTRVPEVAFEQAPGKQPNPQKALQHNVHTVAKINHLNRDKHDGFMHALLEARADLKGLPFAMGDACRMNGERSREFNRALATVRASFLVATATTGFPMAPSSGPRPIAVSAPAAPKDSSGFWDRYHAACVQEDKANAGRDRHHRENVTLARIAALMQILAPETPDLRKGLVQHLAAVSHPEATRALARLALFSAEDEVRLAAVEVLKVRRERDYTDILLAGLRYPYPAVARRAGEALARLERTDLVEQLVNLLEEPDPRLPAVKKVHKKSVPVVRELVRINHHRNCVLCHAPGNPATLSADVVTGGIPTPGESLAPPTGPYGSASPNVVVRVDVTYLRQDFSRMQAVADAHPWPEMQRFDFLVRTRVLSEDEAERYRERLTPREEGRLSPYHRAILAALRELTGRDAAPTPQAWRQLLGLRGKPPLTTH